MNTLHLWPEERIFAAGQVKLGVTLEGSRGDRSQLWYQVPEEFAPRLTDRCDPFVVATVMLAMRQADALRVHGEVSASLVRNLEEFQAIWSNWRKCYRSVPIQASSEQEAVSVPFEKRAITAFSGGVDSCFTAWWHCTGHSGKRQQPLQAGLMVHGFDILLQEKIAFVGAATRSDRILSSLGLELIPIATNFREVIPLDWEDVFGTAVVSSLMLFQGYYTTGLVPASHPYKALEFLYGSNPVSDPFLGSDSFRIVHDGAGSDRATKIRAISEWSEALQYLRVCWEGDKKDRNCGRCEKCIRNILNFRVVGIEHPPCFDRPVSDAEIRALKVGGGALIALQNLYHSALEENVQASWVSALSACIKRNQRLERIRKTLPSVFRRYI
jgi:hypothetical protein